MFTLEAILLYIRLSLGITDPTSIQVEENRVRMDSDVTGTTSYFQSNYYYDSDGDGYYTYEEPTTSDNTSTWDIYETN